MSKKMEGWSHSHIHIEIHWKNNPKMFVMNRIAKRAHRRWDILMQRRDMLKSIEYFDKHNIKRTKYMETNPIWIMSPYWR